MMMAGCSKSYKTGDSVSTNQECFSAINTTCYNVMTDMSVERNESAIKAMIDEGQVYILPSHTHGIVKGYKKGVYEVEFDGYGRLWVASDFIEG